MYKDRSKHSPKANSHPVFALLAFRFPRDQSLVIFHEGKECWEIQWLVSGSVNSVARHHNTSRWCQPSKTQTHYK